MFKDIHKVGDILNGPSIHIAQHVVFYECGRVNISPLSSGFFCLVAKSTWWPPKKKEKKKQSQTYIEDFLEEMNQSHHILRKS